MALATQCPHCHTTFKVAHDQLKLRAGLVRCGVCKQIFNGIEHLLSPEKPEHNIAPPSFDNSLNSTATPNPAAPSPGNAVHGENELPPAEINSNDDTSEKPDTDIDSLEHTTLVDFTYVGYESSENPAKQEPLQEEPVPDEPNPLEPVVTGPQHPLSRPAGHVAYSDVDEIRDNTLDAQEEEPGFVRQGRRRQRIGRTIHILIVLGSFFLLIGLLAQTTYLLRNHIAARFPQAKPLLDQGCKIFGCHLSLLQQIDAVSIESSELQAIPSGRNTFVLTSLLRNRSTIAQAWPNIELTLNDANEKAIARRIFLPRDYLTSGQDIDKGLVARSEQPIKLLFELSQLKASGYRVYLFYP